MASKKNRTDFKVGDTVVYPHHGAAVVEAIEKRTIGDEELDFLVLQINQSDLVVRVPARNAELVGVRDVVGIDGLKKVFNVLRETDVDEAGNWSRRYKANQERLSSGDVNKVAEVVRDLWRRDRDKGLSSGEKRMLTRARQILVGELALADAVDADKATQLAEELQATIARHKKIATQNAAPTTAPGVKDVDLDDLDFGDEDE